MKPNLIEQTEAHNLLAQIYAQTARHQEALDHFAAAVVADSRVTVTVTEGLAEMFEKQEEWKKAIEVYTQGLARCEDASLHNGLAYCLGKIGRLKDAEYHCRQATELSPYIATYANDLGYALQEQGEFEQARIQFDRALHLDPDYELARNNLSRCSKQAQK